MNVAVVGGGIAGLTAALKLAERGWDVTLFEKGKVLGGNLSSEWVNGVYHDVYPHMFCEWYTNFWTLFEKDLGLSREAHFERRDGIKLLRKDRTYAEMRNGNSFADAVANLTCGIEPVPDMFLYGYSMLDLAAQHFEPGRVLSRYSINGFLNSRDYATDEVAELYDFVLMNIWSVNGDQTAAAAYKDFVKYALSWTRDMPFAWMLKGSLEQKLIGPLRRKLASLGCRIHLCTAVEEVRIHARSVELQYRPPLAQPGVEPASDRFDYAVLAVTPEALGELIVKGPPKSRIVDRVPDLAAVRRLRAEAIPVVDLYLDRKLRGIPRENVGLSWSDNLTFIDISQLWTDDPYMRDKTVLVLAQSDFYALPSDTKEEAGYSMIRRLHEYLPGFEPGDRWGDPKSSICWQKTHFQSNTDNRLFINQVGSSSWRPWASYQALPRIVFAGDFVVTDVSMATVEAAVQSGLQAAQALWWRTRQGDPVPIEQPPAPKEAQLLALKLLFTPSAYWAKWWSVLFDAMPHLAVGDLRYGAVTPALTMLSLPIGYLRELWNTGQDLAESVLLGGRRRRRLRRRLLG